MRLQDRLYTQLSQDTESMPKKAKDSVEMQLAALKKAAKSKRVLLVLDDTWSSEHEKPFACVDTEATSSKILLTTRIKGMCILLQLCTFIRSFMNCK